MDRAQRGKIANITWREGSHKTDGIWPGVHQCRERQKHSSHRNSWWKSRKVWEGMTWLKQWTAAIRMGLDRKAGLHRQDLVCQRNGHLLFLSPSSTHTLAKKTNKQKTQIEQNKPSYLPLKNDPSPLSTHDFLYTNHSNTKPHPQSLIQEWASNPGQWSQTHDICSKC